MPRNPMLVVFGALDRTFGRWNAKMGGFAMWKGRQTLPVDDPVAWREQQKRGIGRPHHLCRLGLLIMIPTVLIGMGTPASDDTFMPLMFVGWSLAGLAMVIQGANLIAVERSRQTLEVLLTTPMAAQEIVRQKMRALWRFGVLLAVPLLTLAGLRLVQGLFSIRQMSFYIVIHLLAVPLLFMLLAWGGMWVGLRVQSRGRAIVVALVVLVAWCGIPPLVVFMLEEVAAMMEVTCIGLSLLSPAVSVICVEASISDLDLVRDLGVWSMWAGAAVVIYGILAWWLRRWCLENADRLLGAGGRVRWSRMDYVWAALLGGMFVVGVYLFLAATRIVWELPGGYRHTYSGQCVGMLATGWALLAMAMAGKGASVVAGVRFWPMIDAVAGKPLAARDTLRRKMRVLLGLGMLVPALGIALVHFGPMVGASGSLGSLDFDWTYLLSCLLAVPLLLFSTWSGMWIGLRMKLWGARWLAVLMGLLFSLSPAGVVYMLETGSIMQVRDEIGFIAGCSVVLVVGYGLMAWRVRRLCLENAERLLRGA
jgi:hypothetical protein